MCLFYTVTELQLFLYCYQQQKLFTPSCKVSDILSAFKCFFFYLHDTNPNFEISRKFVQCSRCYVTPCSPANNTNHYKIASQNFDTSREGTVESVHVMKAYRGSEGTTPLNLSIYTSGRPHTPKENSWYPLGATPRSVGIQPGFKLHVIQPVGYSLYRLLEDSSDTPQKT